MRSTRVHGHSIPAPEKEQNEDAFVVRPTRNEGLLLLVCDGMGGMGRGADASRMATAELERALVDGGDHDTLCEAMVATDRRLRRELVDPGPGRPGCTAVGILVHHDEAFVAWAGDARAVHIRADGVVAHTVDHKLVEELVASGTLTRDEALGGRMGHVVTRCLGGRRTGEPAHEPETLRAPWRLKAGDALVLCSDGLSDVVDDDGIAGLIRGCSAQEAVDVLIQAARTRGSADDTTVVVYRHPAPQARSRPVVPGNARPDPLLQASGPVDSATWTPTPPRRTTAADPRPPSTRGADNRLFLIGGAVCLAIAGALAVSWLAGWL